MIAMLAPSEEQALAMFDDDLYARLPDELTYERRDWLRGLLQPLGFCVNDQSDVFHSLHRLRESGRIKIEKGSREGGGYHRRRTEPRPRKATIRKQ